ncbi:DUF6588 family protein [Melioribacteraceae bacterium 4301-Me]|uniref:DUF6588 family protein n=1 Tax=Pyranulibacter aquaticus TaxID=3163344 RepID=UPI00359BF8A3
MKLKLIVLSAILFSSLTNSQTLDETLSNLSQTAGTAYVKPVISAFGSNLNSGWVSQLPEPILLGFHIDLKIIGMGSFFSKDDKNFSVSGTFRFTSDQIDLILQNSGYSPQSIGQSNYNQLKSDFAKQKFDVQFSGPTIIGSKNDFLKIKFPGKDFQSGNTTYKLNSYEVAVEDVKGFLDEIPAFPTAAAQLTLGTIAGTNISFRYFPNIDIKDMGKFSFWGAGALHNPGVWFNNPLPLDVAIGYFYQQLKVGDIFESHASEFGLFIGKTIGGLFAIKPYAGATFESSKTTVKYEYQEIQYINDTPINVNVPIKFELDGNNNIGLLVGVLFKLAAININVDYKAANTNTVSAGVSLGW